jgi:hypothetical protein
MSKAQKENSLKHIGMRVHNETVTLEQASGGSYQTLCSMTPSNVTQAGTCNPPPMWNAKLQTTQALTFSQRGLLTSQSCVI